MRQIVILALLVLLTTSQANAGGSAGSGAVSWMERQSASLIDSKFAGTVLSWFLKITSEVDPVGPAADSVEIANVLVDDAISFEENKDDIDAAIDFALELHGGPVRSVNEMTIIKNNVITQLTINPVLPGAMVVRDYVEDEVEKRGLKAY